MNLGDKLKMQITKDNFRINESPLKVKNIKQQ